MARLGLEYVEAPGEAAFYGPKIDIQLRDPLGHSETISTIQVDFHLPNQFQLEYVGEDGKFHQPVMVHRGVIGTLVRMIAYLIEKYGGAFPLWLAPVQVRGHPDRGPAPGVRRAGEGRACRSTTSGSRWTAGASGCRTRSARPSTSASRTSW